jgi:hypothetical protein
MNHTPGPWRVEEEDVTGDRYIEPSVVADNLDNGTVSTIATIRVGLPATAANTQLIAAAPELLAACKKLANEAAGFLALSDIERHGTTNSRILRDRIEQARDVVRKAEGL